MALVNPQVFDLCQGPPEPPCRADDLSPLALRGYLPRGAQGLLDKSLNLYYSKHLDTYEDYKYRQPEGGNWGKRPQRRRSLGPSENGAAS